MPEYSKLYEIYIRACRSTWTLPPSVGWGRARERGSEKNAARCGKGGSWVSAAEPIKTSTAHYFACFSFDNNAESDPDPDPKKKQTPKRVQSWC